MGNEILLTAWPRGEKKKGEKRGTEAAIVHCLPNIFWEAASSVHAIRLQAYRKKREKEKEKGRGMGGDVERNIFIWKQLRFNIQGGGGEGRREKRIHPTLLSLLLPQVADDKHCDAASRGRKGKKREEKREEGGVEWSSYLQRESAILAIERRRKGRRRLIEIQGRKLDINS